MTATPWALELIKSFPFTKSADWSRWCAPSAVTTDDVFAVIAEEMEVES